MDTVRVAGGRDLPPTYAMAPSPGEPAVGLWRFDDVSHEQLGRGAHAHDFPVLLYIEVGSGTPHGDDGGWTLATGDVVVVAPGDVVGPFGPSTLNGARGCAVSFMPDALGPDVPGAHLTWRTHPLLFPYVRGDATGALRLPTPPADRVEWASRMRALERELTERPDGYREAVAALLVLLLLGVARLAADAVVDLRVHREPLLADVFTVIEQRYAEPLSLRDVATAVSTSAGHLTATVRRRTGRTVQQWITERRMVQARRLLARTTLPVAEIGRRVGYPDAGYFARVFGREHGVSPTRWREAPAPGTPTPPRG